MASINKSPYSIILKPVITEKAAAGGSTAVFEVHPQANKIEIKKAVEKIFDVKVKEVRTLRYQGKVKRVYARTGMQKTTKRAYISLQAGHTINVIEGV